MILKIKKKMPRDESICYSDVIDVIKFAISDHIFELTMLANWSYTYSGE